MTAPTGPFGGTLHDPPSDLLYSTSCRLKLMMNERYYGGLHYLWCSEVFDVESVSGVDYRRMIGSSSSPREIYRAVQSAIRTSDKHCDKINGWRASIAGRAIEEHAGGRLSEVGMQEIVYHAKDPSFENFRPVLYVIPTANVRGRTYLVPPEHRASLGPEYIIPDLRLTECHVLEF